MGDHEVDTLGVNRRVVDVGRIVAAHGGRESRALSREDVIGVVVETIHLKSKETVPKGRVKTYVVGKVTLPRQIKRRNDIRLVGRIESRASVRISVADL